MSTTARNLLASKAITEIYSVKPDQSTFEALQGMGRLLNAQRYIRESAGRDNRVIVVGDQVIGAVTCRDNAAGQHQRP